MLYSSKCDAPTFAPAPSAGIWSALRAAWQGANHRRKLRRTEKMLLALSDRTLKDIGLHRSEIPSVVHDASARHGDARWPVSSRYY